MVEWVEFGHRGICKRHDNWFRQRFELGIYERNDGLERVRPQCMVVCLVGFGNPDEQCRSRLGLLRQRFNPGFWRCLFLVCRKRQLR